MFLLMQVFQRVQNRYEGRMEEHERRVTQVIGSQARDQRGHMLHEQHVLLQAAENRKKVLAKSDALGAAVTQCKFSKMLT